MHPHRGALHPWRHPSPQARVTRPNFMSSPGTVRQSLFSVSRYRIPSPSPTWAARLLLHGILSLFEFAIRVASMPFCGVLDFLSSTSSPPSGFCGPRLAVLVCSFSSSRSCPSNCSCASYGFQFLCSGISSLRGPVVFMQHGILCFVVMLSFCSSTHSSSQVALQVAAVSAALVVPSLWVSLLLVLVSVVVSTADRHCRSSSPTVL